MLRAGRQNQHTKYIMMMGHRNKNLILTIVLSIVVLGLYSCRTSERNLLQGSWFIENATLKGENVGYKYFVGNNVGFMGDGVCIFPISNSGGHGESKWEFTRNGIRIFSPTPFFNDVFKIDTLSKRRLVISNNSKMVSLSRQW